MFGICPLRLFQTVHTTVISIDRPTLGVYICQSVSSSLDRPSDADKNFSNKVENDKAPTAPLFSSVPVKGKRHFRAGQGTLSDENNEAPFITDTPELLIIPYTDDVGPLLQVTLSREFVLQNHPLCS